MKVDSIVERLRQNGYKITPQRQEILKAFFDYDKQLPQSAEDIHRKVVQKYPSISLDTVYRNLSLLQDLEVICKLQLQDGKGRYELNAAGQHHHHLICLKCGAAEAIDFCPFNSLDQKKILTEKAFEITRHSFEIFGYCGLCRTSNKDLDLKNS